MTEVDDAVKKVQWLLATNNPVAYNAEVPCPSSEALGMLGLRVYRPRDGKIWTCGPVDLVEDIELTPNCCLSSHRRFVSKNLSEANKLRASRIDAIGSCAPDDKSVLEWYPWQHPTS